MKFAPGQPKTMTLAALLAGVVSLVPTLWLVLTGHNSGRAAWDSVVFHERFIRQLAAEWPQFDVSNPLSATTPGYHILLATFVVIGLGSELALRLVSALIGASLCGLLAAWLAKRSSKYDAVLLILPLACSSYVVVSGAWLLPDNLGWLGVATILMLTLHPSVSWKPVITASVVLVGLVFVRQVHIWAAVMVWMSAWLNARDTARSVFDAIQTRAWHAAVAGLMTLPAFAVLWWFVDLWGGLTAPRFQTNITGFGPATPAFLLVQIAVFSVGFAPWLGPPVVRTWKRVPRVILAAAVVGLVLATLPDTSYSESDGRYSGFWALAKVVPTIAGRTSPVFLALAPIGAVVFACGLVEAPRRTRWVLLATFVAFATAQSTTINSFQRYHEPMLLILLAAISSVQPSAYRHAMPAKLRLPCVSLLCALLLAVTYRGVQGEPVVRGTLPPPNYTNPDDPWYNTRRTEPPALESLLSTPR